MYIFINMSCLQSRLIVAIIVGWKRINYMIWWCYDVLESNGWVKNEGLIYILVVDACLVEVNCCLMDWFASSFCDCWWRNVDGFTLIQ